MEEEEVGERVAEVGGVRRGEDAQQFRPEERLEPDERMRSVRHGRPEGGE